MSEFYFSPDIEIILENIRLNSIVLSKEHKKRYVSLKDTLKYYSCLLYTSDAADE